MPEQSRSLGELILAVQFYGEEIDFSPTTPEETSEIVRRLATAASYFNTVAVTDFGGRPGKQRTPGMAESAIGAAFQSYYGEEIHPDPFSKAAVMMRGIVQGHPFEDGNKRTGFLTAYYYLQQLGLTPDGELPEDEVVEYCKTLSRGDVRDIEEIAVRIADFWGYELPESTLDE